VHPSIYPLKIRRRFTVVHQHSTGASGITRVENPRVESTRVETAKYGLGSGIFETFGYRGGEDSALALAS
jgi:hypothetical protein